MKAGLFVLVWLPLACCQVLAELPEQKPRAKTGTVFPVAATPRTLTPVMEAELRGCFSFFWNEWVADATLPTHGLNAGDYVGLKRHMPLAIESQGFYFPVIVLGVERGWVEREVARKRVLVALDSLLRLQHFHGFFYHFIDVESGQRGRCGRGWPQPAHSRHLLLRALP